MSGHTAEDLFIADLAPFLPLYKVTSPADLDLIEKHLFRDGDDVASYAILAATSFTVEGEKKPVEKTCIYKVKTNIVSRTISDLDPKVIGSKEVVRSDCWFRLPKIPWSLVRKMDTFFKKVHKLHGSEGILVLTYDPKFLETDNPSDGWGVCVPEQNNNQAHCSYDPRTIMQQKEEHVLIVGTIHSHPGFSAFFSGVDERDQVDHDGLHITQGWPGGKDEYHVAVYSDRASYEFTIDQVVNTPPLPEVDLEVVESWLENVSSTPAPLAHGSTTSRTGTSSYQHTYSNGSSQHFAANMRKKTVKLPADAPSPSGNTIIPVLDLEDTHPQCRMCDTPLPKSALDAHRCFNCGSYFVFEGETVEDLMNMRRDSGRPYVLEIDPEAAPHPIILWRVNDDLDNDWSLDQRSVATPKE